MTYAELNAYVTTIGKEKIFGFNFDNSRRVHRKLKPDPSDPTGKKKMIQTFDERFTLNAALEAIVVSERDVYTDIYVHNYIPIETVQGLYVLDNPEDMIKIDPRYCLG